MQSIEVRHESSCYVGGIDEKVSEAVLWELFIQAGPVTSVYLPKDRLTNVHQGFAFVEMQTEEDADYAIKILNMIKLYNKPIRVNKASAHQKDMDVGANLFIGNLDPNVDEKTLYDVFSSFGVILSPPKIMKDPVTNESKGYGFINFASFESSDAAIEAMNGQFLENKQIHLQYAYKKEAKGERHGSIAERLLAAKNTNLATNQTTQPNAFFADGSNTENQPAGTENNVINLDTNNNMFNPMAGIMVNPIPIAPNMPFMFPNAPQFMPNTQFNLLPPPPGMPLPMMNQNSSSFNLQSTTPGDMSMNAPSQHSVSIPPPPPLNFQNNNMPLVSIQPSASPLPPPHNMPPVPNHDPNSINVHPLPPPPNLQNDIKNLPPTPLQNPNQNGSGTLPPPPQ